MVDFTFSAEKHGVTQAHFTQQFGLTAVDLKNLDNTKPVGVIEQVIKSELDKQRETNPLFVEACEAMMRLALANRGGLYTPFLILMSQTRTLLDNPAEHEAFLRTAQSSGWEEINPELWRSIQAVATAAGLRQALPEGVSPKLQALQVAHSEFANACADLLSLLDNLRKKLTPIQFTDVQYNYLMSETKALMAQPTKNKDFVALAKEYRHVAGEKLSAQMMLVAGWAAKIVTLGSTVGDAWIKFATEKLERIALADKVLSESENPRRAG